MSLARVGEWLASLVSGSGQPVGDVDDLAAPFMRAITDDHYSEVQHVRPVGTVDGVAASWPRIALRPRNDPREIACTSN